MSFHLGNTFTNGEQPNATKWQEVWDNDDALYNSLNGVEATFSPSFTGLTAGNGTTVARYIQIGKRVYGYISFTLGSTSSISGDVSLTLPVTPRSMGLVTVIAKMNILDNGTNNYNGVIVTTGGATASVRYDKVSGSLVDHSVFSSTLPFTWTTNDAFHGMFSYEAA